MTAEPYQEISPGFFADSAFISRLTQSGLSTMDQVFAYQGEDINPQFLPGHRARMRLRLKPDGPVVYLKRYDQPPRLEQIKNWIEHKRRATTDEFDWRPITDMENERISVPHTIAYGHEWSGLFEKRSFIMIQEIANADSLEDKLPACLREHNAAVSARPRREFIERLADFIRIFHDTGYRHRDLYLCHIFLDAEQRFYLIDLQRLFKPVLFSERFRRKDLTQLYYSAPGNCITRSDRLRFYRRYLKKAKLTARDRHTIKRIIAKARRIGRRDRRRGRIAPFMESL
jgi:heptose I phosphotransferase